LHGLLTGSTPSYGRARKASPRNIERILSPRPSSVSLSGGSGSSVSRASAVAVTSVKAEASSSGSVYPARRSPQPSQDVNDCKLADQLPVPRQLEPKSVDNLLRHEVMAHIPTDPPLQCFGHDIVNPKVHGLLLLRVTRKRAGAYELGTLIGKILDWSFCFLQRQQRLSTVVPSRYDASLPQKTSRRCLWSMPRRAAWPKSAPPSTRPNR
jgi:hypothetical protein